MHNQRGNGNRKPETGRCRSHCIRCQEKRHGGRLGCDSEGGKTREYPGAGLRPGTPGPGGRSQRALLLRRTERIRNNDHKGNELDQLRNGTALHTRWRGDFGIRFQHDQPGRHREYVSAQRRLLHLHLWSPGLKRCDRNHNQERPQYGKGQCQSKGPVRRILHRIRQMGFDEHSGENTIRERDGNGCGTELRTALPDRRQLAGCGLQQGRPAPQL